LSQFSRDYFFSCYENLREEGRKREGEERGKGGKNANYHSFIVIKRSASSPDCRRWGRREEEKGERGKLMVIDILLMEGTPLVIVEEGREEKGGRGKSRRRIFFAAKRPETILFGRKEGGRKRGSGGKDDILSWPNVPTSELSSGGKEGGEKKKEKEGEKGRQNSVSDAKGGLLLL